MKMFIFYRATAGRGKDEHSLPPLSTFNTDSHTSSLSRTLLCITANFAWLIFLCPLSMFYLVKFSTFRNWHSIFVSKTRHFIPGNPYLLLYRLLCIFKCCLSSDPKLYIYLSTIDCRMKENI